MADDDIASRMIEALQDASLTRGAVRSPIKALVAAIDRRPTGK